jgi:hypothetical protein
VGRSGRPLPLGSEIAFPASVEVESRSVVLRGTTGSVDALLIAGAGDPGRAAWAVLGFALTLVFQRWVPGT